MGTNRRLRVTPEQDGCCHEEDNDQLQDLQDHDVSHAQSGQYE